MVKELNIFSQSIVIYNKLGFKGFFLPKNLICLNNKKIKVYSPRGEKHIHLYECRTVTLRSSVAFVREEEKLNLILFSLN